MKVRTQLMVRVRLGGGGGVGYEKLPRARAQHRPAASPAMRFMLVCEKFLNFTIFLRVCLLPMCYDKCINIPYIISSKAKKFYHP